MPSVTDQGIVGYMCDNGDNYPYFMGAMRIMTGSCSNMGLYFNLPYLADDAWLIHPGYKVILCRAVDYGGSTATLDNSNGLYVKMFKLSTNQNHTLSFKSYYKGGLQMPDMNSQDLYKTNIAGPA